MLGSTCYVPLASRQCYCKTLLLVLAHVPYPAHVPQTHSLICACVTPTCVCCGRAIMPSLTQSTSITCCNLEHQHLVNVKGTASTPPPCTPSMCICLHTATPLLTCACIAQHSHHYFTSCSSRASQLCFHCIPSEIICSCCRHA